MAELLQRRLMRLKSKLETLRELYIVEDRPLAVDLEIQVIEEQIRNLDTETSESHNVH